MLKPIPIKSTWSTSTDSNQKITRTYTDRIGQNRFEKEKQHKHKNSFFIDHLALENTLKKETSSS